MRDNVFGDSYGFHGHRARRGRMAPLILTMLQEKPMHGYEIISSLETKSGGLWRPSAGSVYPNLQLLEEQELVIGKQSNGKKVYTLTDKGKQAAEEAKERFSSRWTEMSDNAQSLLGPRLHLRAIRISLRRIGSSESEAKMAEAVEILKDADERLAQLIDTKED